jgi:hypothetical protein
MSRYVPLLGRTQIGAPIDFLAPQVVGQGLENLLRFHPDLIALFEIHQRPGLLIGKCGIRRLNTSEWLAGEPGVVLGRRRPTAGNIHRLYRPYVAAK